MLWPITNCLFQEHLRSISHVIMIVKAQSYAGRFVTVLL